MLYYQHGGPASRVAALEPFAAENEWPLAAMYFFHGAELPDDDLEKIAGEAFKFFNMLIYQARRTSTHYGGRFRLRLG
jgi:hypothetical protein